MSHPFCDILLFNNDYSEKFTINFIIWFSFCLFLQTPLWYILPFSLLIYRQEYLLFPLFFSSHTLKYTICLLYQGYFEKYHAYSNKLFSSSLFSNYNSLLNIYFSLYCTFYILGQCDICFASWKITLYGMHCFSC